ncbi:MAG TPA: rhodanese-like domain-containing protein [Symbiobacteriaceae bacterium]|nr:rhodanese-like domain-containing protein [Symbiobacteriaceae bacterium]
MALPSSKDDISPDITPGELAQRLRVGKAPRMIDVREPHEFASGRIPGAESMPLSRFTMQFRSLPQQEELVLVCRSGSRSGLAQEFLQSQGYTKTRNLIDGMLGWNGPVTSGR